MAKARAVFLLQVSLGVAGVASVGLALAAAAGGVSLRPPSPEALWAACQAVVIPDLSLNGALSLVLGMLSFAVIGLALTSAWRQLRASRRLVRALDIVERRRVGGVTVAVADGQQPVAFCAGLMRPQIYVSTGTLAALDRDELQAVVTHERHHARQRDPLRIFVARVLGDALFFLPAARRLGERYASLAELAADRTAVRAAGDSRPLASALLSFEAADPAVVGIAPERVDHLMGQRAAWELPLVLLAWSSIALVAVVAVALRVRVTASTELNVPLLLARSCMLAMAVAPLAIGGFLLAHRRMRSASSRA